MFNRSVGCCNKISGWQFNRLFAGLSKSDQDTIFLVEGIYLISSNLAGAQLLLLSLGRRTPTVAIVACVRMRARAAEDP